VLQQASHAFVCRSMRMRCSALLRTYISITVLLPMLEHDHSEPHCNLYPVFRSNDFWCICVCVRAILDTSGFVRLKVVWIIHG
jgi:hypothetical protein